MNRASRAVGQDRIDSAGYFFQRYGQPFLVAPAGSCPASVFLTALTARTLDMPLRRYVPAEILGAGLWAAYAVVARVRSRLPARGPGVDLARHLAPHDGAAVGGCRRLLPPSRADQEAEPPRPPLLPASHLLVSADPIFSWGTDMSELWRFGAGELAQHDRRAGGVVGRGGRRSPRADRGREPALNAVTEVLADEARRAAAERPTPRSPARSPSARCTACRSP